MKKWLQKLFKFDKPYALSWDAWEEWDAVTSRKHPIKWFFCETIPDWGYWLHRQTLGRLDNLRAYISNRFIHRIHYLHTHLKPGEYRDLDSRILHGNFGSFIDYIEIECAWHLCCMDNRAAKRHHRPWWSYSRLTRWGRWRAPEAGLEYLHWCMTLDDPEQDPNGQHPSQATAAREQLALYNWWKYVYPNRPDPYEVTIGAFEQKMKAKYGDTFNAWLGRKNPLTPQEIQERDAASQAATDLEAKYTQEEEDMLIRLIKHRHHLWT